MQCSECGKEFICKPRKGNFCSRHCYSNHYYRERYSNNPEFREYMKDTARRRKTKQFLKVAERRLDIIVKLGGKCVKCGYVGSALVFHHLTNEKDNKAWYESKNLDDLVDKGAIQLLCSNCHIEHHLIVRNNKHHLNVGNHVAYTLY